MVGMTTSTTRPHSRILKGRPSSVHDTTQGVEGGSTTFTAEQRRRSLRARSSVVNPGKRISIHRGSVDTPGVLSSINANSASGNILNSTLMTSRRTSSKDLNATDARHEKALEAASLVKSATLATKPSSDKVADKENMVISNAGDKAQQRVRDLPSAPSHPIVHAQQQVESRKRGNSLVIPVEA